MDSHVSIDPSADGQAPGNNPGTTLIEICRIATRWLGLSDVLLHIDSSEPSESSHFSTGDEWVRLDLALACYTFSSPERLTIPDLSCDRRFQSNPLVTGPRSLRGCVVIPFWPKERDRRQESAQPDVSASCPLGWLIGFDRRPRQWIGDEIAALEQLTTLARAHLDERAGAPGSPARSDLSPWNRLVSMGLFENAADIVFTSDLTGRLLSVNRSAERLTGYSKAKLLEMNVVELVTAEHRDRMRQLLLSQLGGARPQGCELILETGTRGQLPVGVSAHLLFDRGQPIGLIGLATDRTVTNMEYSAHRRVEGQLVKLSELWNELHRLHTTQFATPGELLRDVLATTCRVLGMDAALLAVDEGGELQMRAHHAEREADCLDMLWHGKQQHYREAFNGRTTRIYPPGGGPDTNGKAAPLILCTPVMAGETKIGVLSCGTSGATAAPGDCITSFLQSVAVLLSSHLAHEVLIASRLDKLTGLANLAAVVDRAELALRKARESGSRFALIVADVDLFQRFTRRYGATAADDLLRGLALRFRETAPPAALVGRLGGDRFAVVLPSVRGGDEALEAGRQLLQGARQPLRIGGETVTVSVSVGVAISPDNGSKVSALFSCADTALLSVKHRGRNGAALYSGQEQTPRSNAIDADLRMALDREQFELRFQPQITIDGRLHGFEVLLGWNHPVHGPLSAKRFIPIAEETGLIVSIGTWVLEEACRCAADWNRRGFGAWPLAVNVSTLQLERNDFVDIVTGAMSAAGVDPGQFELEVTESALMRNAEQSAETILRLRALGLRVAIDDFGTGYSSLSYLTRLAVDTLKIDRSFLDDGQSQESLLPTLEAIVTLAHQLGLSVVGEGVEDVSQHRLLERAGCDRFQGHLFGRPLGRQEAERLLPTRQSFCQVSGR